MWFCSNRLKGFSCCSNDQCVFCYVITGIKKIIYQTNMNACRALTLFHRSVQWSHGLALSSSSRCWDSKCQALFKLLQVNFSSLSTKNPTLVKVHQSQLPAIFYAQRSYATKKSKESKSKSK